jgi:hypothetical protein
LHRTSVSAYGSTKKPYRRCLGKQLFCCPICCNGSNRHYSLSNWPLAGRLAYSPLRGQGTVLAACGACSFSIRPNALSVEAQRGLPKSQAFVAPGNVLRMLETLRKNFWKSVVSCCSPGFGERGQFRGVPWHRYQHRWLSTSEEFLPYCNRFLFLFGEHKDVFQAWIYLLESMEVYRAIHPAACGGGSAYLLVVLENPRGPHPHPSHWEEMG